MSDSEDSLIIEIWKMKATAKGRFAIVVTLGFVFAFMAGATYLGGVSVIQRFGGSETTASIK